MMLVKYVVNVINEGVHESEYLVLYDVLEQGTHRRILALNEHHKQKLTKCGKTGCSNKQAAGRRSVAPVVCCSNKLLIARTSTFKISALDSNFDSSSSEFV